jgi:hypothetical protein
MAGAGFGDRLARGNSKASFTTGAGVSQERWDAAFAPAESTPATAAEQVVPVEEAKLASDLE